MATMTKTGSAGKQGELWSASPSDWAVVQEPLHAPLFEAALDHARVGQGTKLLDAGCGSGYAARLAAHRGARVSGIDASDALVGIARHRVASGDFRVGDVQDLPYLDGSFDAVVAINVLQYAADAGATLAELKRVVAPGGRIVIGMWGEPARCQASAVTKAIVATLPTPPAGGQILDLAAPGTLEALFAKADLHVRSSAEVDVLYEYESLDQFWRGWRGAGPVAGAVRASGEPKVKDAAVTAAKRFQDANGCLHMANVFRVLAAERTM